MSVFADMTDRQQPSIEPSNVVTLSSVKEERDRLEGVVRRKTQGVLPLFLRRRI